MWQQQLRHLVHQRLGFELADDRLSKVIGPHIQRRTAALSLSKPEELIQSLSLVPDSDPEFERLVEVITIGETYFFRDADQMRAMAAFACDVATRVRRPVRIWDAGCATGEEPYTLAMLLHEAKIPFEILATDVLPASVARARAGEGYLARAVRHVPAPLLERSLERVGRSWRVRPAIKRYVTFQVHNMATGSIPLPAPPREPVWDLILCRNVIIYFSRETSERVLSGMLGALSPEGGLWLGAADSVLGLPLALQRVDMGTEHWAWRPGQPGQISRLTELIEGARSNGAPASTYAQVQDAPPMVAPKPAPPPRQVPHREWLARLVEQGLYHSAEAYAEGCLKDGSRDPQVALTLGNLRLKRHAFAEALAAYDLVPPSGAHAAEASYLRALAARKAGEHASSSEHLRRALSLAQDFWPASFLLAGALEREGRALQAEVELERTIEILSRAEAPRLFSSCADILDSVHAHPAEVLALARTRLASVTLGAKHE